MPGSRSGYYYEKKSGAVVIMSLEDYSAFEETAYLLRSPKNAKRLIESIVQLEEGKGIKRNPQTARKWKSRATETRSFWILVTTP